MDEEYRHPELSRRQVALFERNPVCALCYRVCLDLCEEYGGIRFDLLESIVAADELCEKIVQNPWELSGIEYYRNWVRNRLRFSPPAVACTFATVCVTFSCMDDLPAPVRQLARDFQGLIIGEGNELYDCLRSAAYRQDITLAYDTYGEPPPEPSLVHEYEQVCQRAAELEQELTYYKTQLKMKNKSQQPLAPVFNIAGDYIAQQNNEYHTDIHDNTNCPIFACPTNPSLSSAPDVRPEKESTSTSPSVCAESILGIPSERDYKAVRIYIEERSRFDPDFKTFCEANSRVAICQRLSKEFGWMVDPYGLGRNINRKRKKKV